ncbi:MAG: hypothetical protein HFG70_11065 [Hungatella sp.]|nr:hypothetical protein [Hungatella sp.]
MGTVKEYVKKMYNKEIAACSDRELYEAFLSMCQEAAGEKKSSKGKKKLYYISCS